MRDRNGKLTRRQTLAGAGAALVASAAGSAAKAEAGADAESKTFILVPDTETEIQALLKEKITLHPMRAWSDELELRNGGWEGLPRTFIHCVGQEYSMSSEAMVGPARAPGWQFIELDIPRGGMLTHPELVAETFANLT